MGNSRRTEETTCKIGVAVTTRNRIILKVRTDIINHLYIRTLDIWKLEGRGGRKKSSTRVVNVNNNHLRTDYTWNEVRSNTRRKELADTG